MLTRLIYASQPTQALTPASVQDLVDRARHNNARRHLSGMLTFDSRCFLQVLEGPRSQLSALFCRIAADPRHERVELLEMVSVDERLFAHWSMGFAPADAHHGDVYMRFGDTPHFEPHAMRAGAALGLLQAIAQRGTLQP